MNYRVKEVANIVGISVRMLHHYDKIGLHKPESVSPAGYRIYTDKDLERLQQILFLKELEFSLKEIKSIINSPGFDKKQALKAHKVLLMEKKDRLAKIISTLDQTIISFEGEFAMDNKESFAAFDMNAIEKHKAKYVAEVKLKWGHTEAYQESQSKTAKYTAADWAKITARQDQIYRRLATFMDKDPADPRVQEVIAEHRQHISDNFYNCTPELFSGLGDLYVNDQRFTANIDKYRPGLVFFLRKAIDRYCANLK